MTNAEKIAASEWLVMQVLWDLKEATASDIIGRLEQETGWNHRTIRTLVRRLVDKGLVTYRAEAQRYVYQPAVSRQSCVREEGQTFLDRVFRGDASSLLLHFARDAGLSREKIKQLRSLLDEPKKHEPGDLR